MKFTFAWYLICKFSAALVYCVSGERAELASSTPARPCAAHFQEQPPMHAPLAPHEKAAIEVSSPIALWPRIWPPAVLIVGTLLTLTWSAFLMYVIARLVIWAF
jgi:hypothetical protein